MSSRYSRFVPSVAQISGSYFLAPSQVGAGLGDPTPPRLRWWASVCQQPMAVADKPARNIVAGNSTEIDSEACLQSSL